LQTSANVRRLKWSSASPSDHCARRIAQAINRK
jgi:hypothetical protein